MKKRKEPLRKCVATGEMLNKKDLLRVVKNKEGEIFVDPSGKAHGRGAYVKKDKAAVKALRKRKVLDKVFSVNVDESVYDAIEDAITS